MKTETFTFKEETGLDIFVYKWVPDGDVGGVVQISHGMAETASRYERFAEALTGAGYVVYANDHRGHGRTVNDVERVGDLGEDGFNNMIRNMRQLDGIIKEEHPGLPFFMFGHSMGSFLLQRYMCLYGDRLDGAILSGSNGRVGFLLSIGAFIAKREIKKLGRGHRSVKLNRLSFGGYNKPFKPNRTAFDWLSRDEAEVDKYVNNPFCGGVFTSGFFYDLSEGLKLIEDKREIQKVPKGLPIYIFSGDNDPVGKFGKGVKRLVNTYKKAGITNVQHRLYKGGRHEMLNETNRDNVIQDTLTWLNHAARGPYMRTM